MHNTTIEVAELTKLFPMAGGLFSRRKRYIHAVDGVSLKISKGESLGLVGESGCGKTTMGKLMVKLISLTSGHIYFEGSDIAAIEDAALLKSYRRKVQMIFQDPYESMNPRKTIYDIVAEPLLVQKIGHLAEREMMVAEMLDRVDISPADTFMFRYPHELSGGQRQRVAIARAMIINPTFVVADEPTSMLDVSVRTGVMKLMMQLREEFDLAMLYITHDLAVARYMCDRMGVMYLGRMVELAETEAILQNPLHPYTKALISAVPIPDPTFVREAIPIKGGVSKPVDPHPRCRFYDRCPSATEHCEKSNHPPVEDKGSEHYVACYEA